MASHLITVSKVQGASYKVAELIIKKTTLEVKEGGFKSETHEGRILMENVNFSYPTKKDVTVLNKVNIDVKSN